MFIILKGTEEKVFTLYYLETVDIICIILSFFFFIILA